jgi:acyl-CoA reductase-like NAD-dependent aldehyde dehydrogenase
MISAFYLPLGLEEGLETSLQRFGPAHDALELHLPVVQADDLLRWIEALREARESNLSRRPIAEIVRALDRVVRRFLDAADPARREAVESLSRSGRWTAPMVEHSLDDAFQPLARGGLAKWVAFELGSTEVLDRPVGGASGVLRRAHGPEWMLQIYAGNVPSLPIWPMFSALLLKSALLAKTSAQEPLLAPLLARTIAEADQGLGACIAAVWWKGGTNDLDRAALSQAPAVLAFGAGETVANLGRLARPGSKLVLHGPKVSVAYVERRALHYAALRSLVARAALDVSLYDQQGCLSPHCFYVERRGEVPPAKFAEAFALALGARSQSLPRGIIGAEEAARVQLYRAQARFEAAGLAALGFRTESSPAKESTGVLESPGTTAWTVVVEDRARFEPGPQYRTVRVAAVDGPEEVARVLGASVHAVEALGLEARVPERGRLSAYFAGLGIPRVAPIGQLQRPSPLGTHGGLRRLTPFVTWSTIEEPTGPGSARESRPTGKAPRPSGRGSKRKGPGR